MCAIGLVLYMEYDWIYVGTCYNTVEGKLLLSTSLYVFYYIWLTSVCGWPEFICFVGTYKIQNCELWNIGIICWIIDLY